MDPTTIAAYDTHGKAFAERYRSGERVPVERLRACFENRTRILEIGIGSGIDMARLMEAGYDVTGLEPSRELVQLAEKYYPCLSGRILRGALPLDADRAGQWRGRFEGILCNAVLMHIPEIDQQQALKDMHALLATDGRLLLTVSETRDNLDTDRRDEFGRFYAHLPKERVLRLCEDAGLKLLEIRENEDAYHRRGIRWTLYFLSARSSS